MPSEDIECASHAATGDLCFPSYHSRCECLDQTITVGITFLRCSLRSKTVQCVGVVVTKRMVFISSLVPNVVFESPNLVYSAPILSTRGPFQVVRPVNAVGGQARNKRKTAFLCRSLAVICSAQACGWRSLIVIQPTDHENVQPTTAYVLLTLAYRP